MTGEADKKREGLVPSEGMPSRNSKQRSLAATIAEAIQIHSR
jgi:hypothetical protein